MNSDQLNAFIACATTPLLVLLAMVIQYFITKYKERIKNRIKNKCIRCKKETEHEIYRYCRACSGDRAYF